MVMILNRKKMLEKMNKIERKIKQSEQTTK